ncbi:MAG: hypothetical protein LBM66_01695 [Bifidobacteriaceae bacterium]|jgi:uncharacterized protein YukE|nr:hypothetical protein [Bifidobacteriaceae bacterium]
MAEANLPASFEVKIDVDAGGLDNLVRYLDRFPDLLNNLDADLKKSIEDEDYWVGPAAAAFKAGIARLGPHIEVLAQTVKQQASHIADYAASVRTAQGKAERFLDLIDDEIGAERALCVQYGLDAEWSERPMLRLEGLTVFKPPVYPKVTGNIDRSNRDQVRNWVLGTNSASAEETYEAVWQKMTHQSYNLQDGAATLIEGAESVEADPMPVIGGFNEFGAATGEKFSRSFLASGLGAGLKDLGYAGDIAQLIVAASRPTSAKKFAETAAATVAPTVIGAVASEAGPVIGGVTAALIGAVESLVSVARNAGPDWNALSGQWARSAGIYPDGTER